MVGKIQAKSRRKSRETTGTVAAAEVSFLRNNNHELAKALAQAKSDFSQILTERDYLHRELLTANIQIKKLESYLEVIETSTKNAFKNIVASSGDITKTIQTVLLARKVTRRLENAANTSILHISMQNNDGGNVPLVKNNSNTPTSPQNCKTQAVKPMVDGHVIFRPTINLRRVNEIPREPTEHSTDTRPSSESVHNSTNALDDSVREETEPQQNTSFRCRSTSTYQRSQFPNGILPDEDTLSDEENQLLQNNVSNDEEPSETESEDNRLQTLQEEEEVSDRSNQSETAQLTNTGNPNDVMIGVFTGVKLFTCNPSQNIPEIAEETNGSGNSTTENSILENNETLTRLRMINTHRGTGERVHPSTVSTLTDLSVSEADSTVVSRSKGRTASTSGDLYLSSTTNLSLPSTSGLTQRRSNTKKEESFRLRSSPRNNSTLISRSSFVGTSVDLNDLSQNELSKLHQMTLLGLEPSILRNSTSTPYSPVVNLRRQKVLKKIQETPPSSSSYSPNSEETTLSSSSADTPKRKGKQSKIVLKTARVILKRLPVAKRNSISPAKNEKKRKTSLEKKTLTRKSRTSNEVTPRRKRSRARSEIALLSPQRLSNSPIKPRRRLPLKSLKEPSINRKMRR